MNDEPFKSFCFEKSLYNIKFSFCYFRYSINDNALWADQIAKSGAKNVKTREMKATLTDLLACEDYFIRVEITGPNVKGPLSDITQERTDFDNLAPPKVKL